jgi:DNA-binding response OmpR family regulator
MDLVSMQAAGEVLVVDDDTAIALLLEEVLTEEGYRVRMAYDGLAGWRAIQAAAPALLVTDIRMPRMSGTELVRKVRASGYDFPIVIIAATPELAQPLLLVKHTEYLAKPFDLHQFLDRVARHVAPVSLSR